MTDSTEVASPCIGICVVDESNQLCQGCFRSLDEIQDWCSLNNAQKQKVVIEANQRAAALFD